MSLNKRLEHKESKYPAYRFKNTHQDTLIKQETEEGLIKKGVTAFRPKNHTKTDTCKISEMTFLTTETLLQNATTCQTHHSLQSTLQCSRNILIRLTVPMDP